MADQASGFSIGELSRRTGVPVATLRTWESRYGQPQAHRLPSGHRRYDEAAVRAVERIRSQRAAGVTLDAASRLAATDGMVRSVYAGLREQHPELTPYPLAKPTLLQLTRAVEDEYLAGGRRGVLFGAFQRAHFFERSRGRWLDLARASEFAAVLADFDEAAVVDDSLVLAPLPGDAPLTREWLIVCDGPGFTACVAGWEPPDVAEIDAERRFETVWTVDPFVVRTAARICLDHVAEYLPDGGAALEARLAGSPPRASADLARATQLFQRLVGYLAARG